VLTVEPDGRIGQLLVGMWAALGTWILLATTTKRIRDFRKSEV
jgi:hypothetical protein